MDINELKSLLEKKAKTVSEFYRPTNGDVVRFIVGKEKDYKILFKRKHIIDDVLNVCCEDDCPICKRQSDLREYNSMNGPNDAINDIIKKLYPRDIKYALFYIVSSSNEENVGKVKWWKMNNEVFTSLSNLILTSDSEGIDITKIDLTVNCQAKKISNKIWDVANSLTPSMKEKPIKEVEEVCKKASEYELTFNDPSKEEIAKILSDWVDRKLRIISKTDDDSSVGELINKSSKPTAQEIADKVNKLLK